MGRSSSSEAGLSLLEQSKIVQQKDESAKTPKSCTTSNVPYLWTSDREKKKRLVQRAMCKQWGCEYCSRKMRDYHLARIINGYNQLSQAGTEFNFVTLTMHERLRTFEATVKVWRDVWKKLSSRMRYASQRNGLKPIYVYVPEKHKDGRCHIHGLFSTTLDTRWWKDNLRSCGGGYMAESTRCENGGLASWYVSKYINKHMGQSEWIAYFRRINYCRSFPRLPKPDDSTDWFVFDKGVSLLDFALRAWDDGYEVIHEGEALNSDHWLD